MESMNLTRFCLMTRQKLQEGGLSRDDLTNIRRVCACAVQYGVVCHDLPRLLVVKIVLESVDYSPHAKRRC